MTDFGFSELAADDAQLDGDVAQLLTATAVRVGPECAVASAAGVVGAGTLERAAPRLQPAALGSSTRSAVAENKRLLDACPIAREKPQFERLRSSARRSRIHEALLR